MTADEIKAKIGFETRPGYLEGTYTVIASIEFSVAQTLRDGYPHEKDAVLRESIKEDMREAILRNIFNDQRSEMAYAVCKFLESHYPGSHSDAMKAQELLFKAARYQPPSTNPG